MKTHFYTLPILLWLTTFPILGQGLFSSNFDKKETSSIRASMLPDNKSIYLLWEPPSEDGEIIIARSNSIIDTPEKLYVADSLGRFPIQGKNTASNYYDYNLKPGTYYYAIVTVEAVKKRTVVMLADQNYTTKPISIEETSAIATTSPLVSLNSNASNKTKTIGNLLIKAEGSHIRVSWTPPWNAIAKQTIYSLYRSNSPMNTMENMRKADKLVELSHPINTYLDLDLAKSQTLYYGVSVKEDDQAENLPLEKNVSYRRIFFILDKKGNAEVVKDNQISQPASEDTSKPQTSNKEESSSFTVRGFGYDRKAKGATLKWNPPNGADDTTQYTIYASTRSFDEGVNSFVGGTVLKVAVISHPKTSISIKEIKQVESLYFAVTAKKADIAEDFNLSDGNSFFKYEFDKDLVPEEKKEEITTSTTTNPEITKTNPSDIPKLSSNLDKPKDDTVTEGNPENTSNQIEEPSIIYNSDSSILDEILRTTYQKKEYSLAIYKLTQYAKVEKDTILKGKAMFFMGICYFHLGEFKKSLKLFNRIETVQYNAERSQFWKNRSLDRIARGGK